MIRVGWAKEDPVFRRVFTSRFIPDATEEQMRWFDDLQRMSTSPANAVASRIARQQVDIEDELPGSRRRRSSSRPSATGRRRSTTRSSVVVARSRVPASSRSRAANHILLADEPAWRVFIDEVAAFLEPDRRAHASAARPRRSRRCRRRELDVLARWRPTAGRTRRSPTRSDAERPDGRAPPLERLRASSAWPGERPGRLPSRTTCASRLTPDRARLRVGRQRRAGRARSIGVAARFLSAVASRLRSPATARPSVERQRGGTDDDHDDDHRDREPLPSRPLRRQVDAGGDGHARSTGGPACRPGRSTGMRTCPPRSAARTSRRARPPTCSARWPGAASRSCATRSRRSSTSRSTT